MLYLGGKARISKQLSSYINSRLTPQQPYWEPFVGAAWVISNIDGKRQRYASDIHYHLIKLWKALQNGWIPPDNISEEEYRYIKNNKVEPYLKAFVGFGCSFGGKWFGGYARDPKSDRNYALGAKNSLLKIILKLQDVYFFNCDYKKPNPENFLIYCDIPYRGTTEYKDKFDHEEFWNWARKKSKNNIVLVSEYKAPLDFELVWEIERTTNIGDSNNKKINRIERLFEYKGKNK